MGWYQSAAPGWGQDTRRGTQSFPSGRESAYLVRTDDDGLQFLQRYALNP
jgi:hypothetical protein